MAATRIDLEHEVFDSHSGNRLGDLVDATLRETDQRIARAWRACAVRDFVAERTGALGRVDARRLAEISVPQREYSYSPEPSGLEAARCLQSRRTNSAGFASSARRSKTRCANFELVSARAP